MDTLLGYLPIFSTRSFVCSIEVQKISYLIEHTLYFLEGLCCVVLFSFLLCLCVYEYKLVMLYLRWLGQACHHEAVFNPRPVHVRAVVQKVL
jgi:hypothetical protein